MYKSRSHVVKFQFFSILSESIELCSNNNNNNNNGSNILIYKKKSDTTLMMDVLVKCVDVIVFLFCLLLAISLMMDRKLIYLTYNVVVLF